MVLALVFVGCGGGGSPSNTGTATNTGSGSDASSSQTAQINGAWQARANSNSPNALALFVEANLTQSSASVQSTAFLIVNSCVTANSGSKVTGTINGNIVTLTASYSGVTVNLTGTVSTDGSTMAGTYVATGVCGSDAGTWTAQRLPQVSGTYSGMVTSNSTPTQHIAVQGAISADANYNLTGSATVTSSCLKSLSFSGSQIGAAAVITGTDNVGDRILFTFLASDSSFGSFTGIYQVTSGPCSPDTGLGILSKSGSPSGSTTVIFSSTNLSFGNVNIGSAASLAVTLTNPNNAFLSISSINVTQPFSQTNTCSSSSGLTALAPNQSCTLTVTFIPTGVGSFNGSITVVDTASNSPQVVMLTGAGTSNTSPNFTVTGNMTTGRYLQTATMLNTGKVLVVGGLNGFGTALSSAELYDPSNGTFALTGSMTSPRFRHTATLLNDGRVLIVGGESSGTGPPSPLASAEIYDPASGTFTAAGTMSTGRYFHTVTTLPNGKVLVAGGVFSTSNGNFILSSAELYDPVAASFTLTGSLNNAREEHTATLLTNGTGMVLIVGGNNGSGGVNGFVSAELYNPATGAFITTGNPNTARSGHVAHLLNTGKVLIAAGYVPGGHELTTSELYDPTTGTFSLTGSLSTAREFQRSSLLNNGMVLITGGLGQSNTSSFALASAELYDPANELFASAGDMSFATYWQTETLLGNGDVLVAGGNSFTPSASDLYVPTNLAPTGLVSIAVTPSAPTISLSATQQFTATGTFSDGSMQTLQSVTWSSSNQNVATITNDATNRGVAVGITTGQTTITASAGSISRSIVLTVQ
jgi:Bacterial Ig-like domain (group 2)/Abnormal spindle-like microcephaly-assoc'd, ASPM-SPD-2-Hydin/Galactose oxidase, central domain